MPERLVHLVERRGEGISALPRPDVAIVDGTEVGETSFLQAVATESARDRHANRDGCAHVLTTPHVEVHGDEATGRSYALNIRWDPDADRFWIAHVSANIWRWTRTPHPTPSTPHPAPRTPDGWRIAERVNAPLDGSAAHRAMLAPAKPADADWRCWGTAAGSAARRGDHRRPVRG
ncbi:nuclear transport factor 2 family protein, partial [Frankia sp. AgKG'84/4]|uniref:nuclear transport factor 2 family protein n=1 Tax=Frankia sp. AgKG'84/4 TaxID=573490 RepID=UPI00202AA989